MSFSTLATLLSIVTSLMKLIRDFFSFLTIKKRNRKIKRGYKEVDKIIDDGDVDAINEIIKK